MSVISLRIVPAAPVPAGTAGRWELHLHGHEPLEAGASLRVEVPLGWTPPSLHDGPGRVRWWTTARALLLGEVVRRRYLQLNLTGGRLEPGDVVVIAYGDDKGATTAQPWVTDTSPLFHVELSRDGMAPPVPVAAAPVMVEPGPPAYLHAVVPSAAAPEAVVPLRVRVLDRFGNLCGAYADQLRLPDGRTVPLREGRVDTEFRVTRPGVHRIDVVATESGLRGRSNPCWVASGAAGPWWGDPHVHTRLSDGVGSPEFALAYARDVACLDFTAITDHDIEFHHAWFARRCQRLSDVQWVALGEAAAAYRLPGRFAVLRAYEWTGRPYGDRCVYLRDGESGLHRYERDGAPTLQALWQQLRQTAPGRALVVPHTVASATMGAPWAHHDGELERLVEIYSMHGSCEDRDSPSVLAEGVPGWYVRDALARGYRVGFTAGGDMHSSQPGNPLLQVGPYRTLRHRAGLTAVWATRVDEAALWDAMWARRTYATTGARIVLHVTVCGATPGETLDLPPDEPVVVDVRVHGTARLTEVAVVRNGHTAHVLAPGQEDVTLQWVDRHPVAGDAYYYVRVVQEDGHVAWATPVWVDRRGPGAR